MNTEELCWGGRKVIAPWFSMRPTTFRRPPTEIFDKKEISLNTYTTILLQKNQKPAIFENIVVTRKTKDSVDAITINFCHWRPVQRSVPYLASIYSAMLLVACARLLLTDNHVLITGCGGMMKI